MLDLNEILSHLLGHQNHYVVCFLPSLMRKVKYMSKRNNYDPQVKYMLKLKKGIYKKTLIPYATSFICPCIHIKILQHTICSTKCSKLICNTIGMTIRVVKDDDYPTAII